MSQRNEAGAKRIANFRKRQVGAIHHKKYGHNLGQDANSGRLSKSVVEHADDKEQHRGGKILESTPPDFGIMTNPLNMPMNIAMPPIMGTMPLFIFLPPGRSTRPIFLATGWRTDMNIAVTVNAIIADGMMIGGVQMLSLSS